MKRYIVDANVLLRFFLRDHRKHFQVAKSYLNAAKEGKVELTLIPTTVFELNYVLRGVYTLTRKEAAEILAQLVKTPYINVVNRDILISAVERYKKVSIDLTDIYIYLLAEKEKAEVLTFDKDFDKLKQGS